VSRICAELDGVVAACRNRPLDQGPYPFVWIDALSMRVREAGRICQTAVREILGLDSGARRPAWPLGGVQLLCGRWSRRSRPSGSPRRSCGRRLPETLQPSGHQHGGSASRRRPFLDPESDGSFYLASTTSSSVIAAKGHFLALIESAAAGQPVGDAPST
jgi:hypothetical protein